MLVSDFLIDRFAVHALRSLPLLSVVMKPDASQRTMPGSLWPLPVKKQSSSFALTIGGGFTFATLQASACR